MKKILRVIAYIVVGIFTLIGVAFTAVFFAMQYGLLNVRGSIAERNNFFLTATAPATHSVFVPSSPPIDAEKQVLKNIPCVDTALSVCSWHETPEWVVIRDGLQKDSTPILRAAHEVGVSARMIAAVAVPEQIRFFTSEREVFKRYFEPLKILGSLSQFSLGVTGVKQETARAIEAHAADPTSPFYPGAGLAELVAYPQGVNHDDELFRRLTDDKNHYYSYLYTALYIKEIETQWQRAGFPIEKNPAVVVTLFNLGFAASHPNAHPQVAGATITVGGQTYTYGELGTLFFNSNELTTIFIP